MDGNPSTNLDKTKRVLLVEDDEDFRALLKVSFESANFEVELASDGRTALWAMRQRCPDVVVCDYLMPYMDGGELLRQVRSLPQFRHLPFVMMTASPDALILASSLGAGADGYIRKPLQPDEMVQRVCELLREKTDPHFQGDLAHLALGDLLRLLAETERSGTLELVRREENFAFLFEEGRLEAVVGLPTQIEGKKAAYRAFAEEAGEFLFHAENRLLHMVTGRLVVGSIANLCKEGMMQRARVHQILSTFHTQKPLFRQIREVRDDAELSPLEQELLGLMGEGMRAFPLKHLLNSSKAYDLEILQALRSLLDRKILSISEDMELDLPTDDWRKSSSSSEIPVVGNPFSPNRLGRMFIYRQFREGLLEGNYDAVMHALQQAFQEKIPPEVIFHKMLGGVMAELLVWEAESVTPLPLELNTLTRLLELVLQQILPLLIGQTPTHGTVVLARPKGEIGTFRGLTTFLRASGFAVVDLGGEEPERIVNVAIESSSSMIGLFARTEQGNELLQYTRYLLNQRNFSRYPIVVGGALFGHYTGPLAPFGLAGIARSSLEYVSLAYQILQIPIVFPQVYTTG